VGGATDLFAELLVHGLLATLIVESLVHWLPLHSPAARFPYRVSALLAPPLFTGLFAVAAPFRQEDWFQDLSLFVSARWDLIRIGPLDARSAALAAAAAAGALLLARDLLHAVRDAVRERRERASIPLAEPPEAVAVALESLSRGLGLATPAMDVLTSRHHTLHCRGWRTPRIVVSSGTLDALSEEELRAALAHELAHVAHGDVPRGWALLALRGLQWFNPLAQAMGRRAAQELEWRADDQAARATGGALPLARALLRCARHRGDQFLGLSGQGRFRTLEERCRRLMQGVAAPDGGSAREIAVLWTGLALLLVFVQ
jgi:Zn-dependent protease with chaperone function